MESADIIKDRIKSCTEDTIDKCKDIASLLQIIRSVDSKLSLSYALDGLKISKRIGYNDGVANFNDNIGIINIGSGNYLDALNHFNLALTYYLNLLTTGSTINEEYRQLTTYRLSTIKNNIAITYDNLGLLNEALSIQLYNLDYYKYVGRKREVLLTIINISSIYYNLQLYPKSVDILDVFFKYYIENKLEYEVLLGMAYFNKTDALYFLNSSKDKDLTGYAKAKNIFIEHKQQHFLRLVYKKYSEHFESIGDYTNMLKYAGKAILIYNVTGFNVQQDLLYNMLYKYYKKIGDEKNAYKYLELENVERNLKNKESAIRSIKQDELKQLLIQEDLIFPNCFPLTDTVKLVTRKGEKSIHVLRIAHIILANRGLVIVKCYDGEIIETIEPFVELMAKIEKTAQSKYFFKINARTEAINLYYRGLFNRKLRKIDLIFKSEIQTLEPTHRQNSILDNYLNSNPLLRSI